MTISEAFEGENSSLKKTFDEVVARESKDKEIDINTNTAVGMHATFATTTGTASRGHGNPHSPFIGVDALKSNPTINFRSNLALGGIALASATTKDTWRERWEKLTPIHRVGSHSDDWGGSSDNLCFCEIQDFIQQEIDRAVKEERERVRKEYEDFNQKWTKL